MTSFDPEAIRTETLDAIQAAGDADALAAIERRTLGKEGAVGQLLASIKDASPEDRPRIGAAANKLKAAVEAGLAKRRAALASLQLDQERKAEGFDPTLPAATLSSGSLHPVTRVSRELEDIFTSMGYRVLDGPEVELDYYNFEALNIPSDHPAREMYDTFWCDNDSNLLLRTHTSPVQIRALEKLEPPFRAIVPGRCFRNETMDASHEHTFHQMEGLVVGENITVGHLIGTMRTFLREVFKRELEVRLRPGYFPFVEPGFEMDVRCPFCESGCSVCKRTTWIELCPCGMVHPAVLNYGGVDPEKYTGFAFGLGLSRLVMLRYRIDDIRHLMGGDLRFLEQF
ncbi:MAG: phenylalanyl-tRNA synthetase alpha chain [Planctomycetota bacterium]|jgi:phenylalanyl-tRNA synthetase alpha chain